MNELARKALLAALVAAGTATAAAQGPPPGADGWQVEIGGATIVAPRALGSKESRFLLVPTVGVRFGDWAFFDPIKGLGLQTKLTEGLSASAALGVSLDARRSKDDRRVEGLGDIPEAAALILGLDEAIGDAFVSSRLQHRLARGNRRGTVLDVDLGYNVLASQVAIVGVGLTLRAMDGTFARNFLGVDAAQSAASGLPAFDADAGLQRAGLFAQIVYRLGDEWTLFGRVEPTRLTGRAGRSPVVERRQQTTVVLSVVRAL